LCHAIAGMKLPRDGDDAAIVTAYHSTVTQHGVSGLNGGGIMAIKQWTLGDVFRTYGPIYVRKMGLIAAGWVIVYFVSQPFRAQGSTLNMLMLFSPLIGAVAGMVAGWYMATNAVEDSGLHGLLLWVFLVFGSILPMWIIEGFMHLLLPHWAFDFGGWMLMSAAMLMAMASAVWLASSQE
jgi:hypothetical protein